MSTETIFDSTGQTSDHSNSGGNANTATSQPDTSFAHLLGDIKNEKGEAKYRDLPTALDALKHSQEYIPQLKTENETLKQELQRLREEADRLKIVEESLERLSSKQTQPAQPQGLDEKSIADLVTRTLSQREVEAQRSANIQTVVNAMKNSLGENAEREFYSKAAELGMSKEQVNQLSADSPSVVLKLFGVEQKQGTKSVSPTVSSLNTSGYQQKPDSFVKKNDKNVLIGATSQDLINEARNSKQLVDELHAQGLTTYDLSDPKQFFKHFN